MLFVYVMLGAQPFFITGIDDVEATRASDFGALLTFVGTFALSMVVMRREGSGEKEGYEGEKMGEDHNRLNIDLKRDYGSVPTDSY